MQQQPVLYDFASALAKLQDKIQQLSAAQQAAAAPSSRLGITWAFLKQYRGNVLLLLTFYSMSTASVVGSIMSEHRLQSDRLLEGQQTEQLQRHIHKLEQQVQQQQRLLDSIAADMQQQHSSGGWGATAALRQRLLARLHQWKAGEVQHDSVDVSSSGSSGRVTAESSAAGPHQQRQQEFGVRVGPLGRGFLI